MARTKSQSTKFRKGGKATKKRAMKKPATKAYVKQMISRGQEQKQFHFQALGATIPVAYPISWNLNYHGVTRGTGEGSFIGNGYKIKVIQANFQLSNYAQTLATGLVPVKFVCMIVKTKVFKTGSSLALSDLFDESLGLVNTTASIFRDSDKCKILKQRTVTINPDPSPTRAAIRGKTVNLRAVVNTQFRYRDFDSSYEGNTYNYYALVFAMNYPGDGTITSYRGDVYTRLTFADA